MLLIRPLKITGLTRLAVVSRTAPIRLFIRANAQPIRSLGVKTTSTKTAGPGPAPEKLLPSTTLLYHAGTARVTFLACLKLSTLFIFAFFGFVVTPAYYEKEGLSPTVARTALCAIVPMIFVGYTTSPFVAWIHLRLPPFARHSRAMLGRYMQTLSPQTEVEVTTMSFIAKPRTSRVRLSELVPVNRRFGIVNLARDTAAENTTRKWYMFRAVGNFNVQKRKMVNGTWNWDFIHDTIIAKQR
ncbi:hypothetical protein GGR58DRAFT_492524 [Xylaria digitata]|nr:hypothetical protein GGR58DRAFT_492524 [Xylaria digitata]